MILLIIGVTITGFFTSQLAKKFYMDEVEEKLTSAALLLDSYITGELSDKGEIDYNLFAKKYSKLIAAAGSPSKSPTESARITIVSRSGKVLGESYTDYQSMENHLNRNEIHEALQGKVGKDIRSSQTLNVDFLYIAVPAGSAGIIVRISVPLVQLRNIYNIIFIYTVLSIIAGLIFTSVLAFKFSSSITRPISDLMSLTREISSGNYSARVHIKDKNEIGQLAGNINAMTATLEKTMSEIMDKSLKVESIINSMPSGIVAVDTNSKVVFINSIACEIFGIKNDSGIIGANILEFIRNSQINSFLKESIDRNKSLINEISLSVPQESILRIYTTPIKPKDENLQNSGGLIFIEDITTIRKLEQIRTEFVSNVTHELKTPLTSIRGFIETLRAGAMDDRDVAGRFLEIIDIEAERLYNLINDILQLSEIESKPEDVDIALYSLKSIFEDTISILQGTADKKEVSLIMDVGDDLKIRASRNRIKQMLINLIENAIKYNIDHGSVTVKAYRTEGKVVISVKDTGIGIPSEHHTRIFERFYRVDKGRSRNMGGTGLGLSIVKHIANLYNGDIKVYSTVGSGSEFIVSLPG